MNLQRNSLLLAMVGCVLLAAPFAEAGIVFLDGFEDDTFGALPAISGSNVGGSYGSALNTLAVSANPEANGNTSSQVLAGAGASTFANNIPALFAGGAQPINGLVLSYDFYSSTGSHDNDGVRVALVGDADGNRDVFIRNDRDTAILIDGTAQTETNFGAEAWQNFTGVFTATDASAGQYNLAWSVTNLETAAVTGGVQAVTINTANFTDGKARGLLVEVFEGNAGANDFTGYIDNVSVTAVPEPGTAALFVLGGLAALLIRLRTKAEESDKVPPQHTA